MKMTKVESEYVELRVWAKQVVERVGAEAVLSGENRLANMPSEGETKKSVSMMLNKVKSDTTSFGQSVKLGVIKGQAVKDGEAVLKLMTDFLERRVLTLKSI